MLNYGKKFPLHAKKSFRTKKNPYPPSCKLNGRSLIKMHEMWCFGFWSIVCLVKANHLIVVAVTSI